MGKWAARLAEKTAVPPYAGTAKTDKRGVLSVLAVSPKGGAENFSPATVMGLPARPYGLSAAEADRCHAEAWDDVACARFVARVGRFEMLGIDTTDAEDLAERLHLRDLEGDDRRLCLECANLSGRRCGQWRQARLCCAAVPADLIQALQRCNGFKDTTP